MERKLTENQAKQVCMYMRVIDLMQKNWDILDANPELKVHYEKICKRIEGIMEKISDEEKDEILEMHKMQLDEIKK